MASHWGCQLLLLPLTLTSYVCSYNNNNNNNNIIIIIMNEKHSITDVYTGTKAAQISKSCQL